VDWLAQTLLNAPLETEARLTAIAAPATCRKAWWRGLTANWPSPQVLHAWPIWPEVTYDTGATGHVLAFVDALEGAEKALASAAGEALTFSGIERG